MPVFTKTFLWLSFGEIVDTNRGSRGHKWWQIMKLGCHGEVSDFQAVLTCRDGCDKFVSVAVMEFRLWQSTRKVTDKVCCGLCRKVGAIEFGFKWAMQITVCTTGDSVQLDSGWRCHMVGHWSWASAVYWHFPSQCNRRPCSAKASFPPSARLCLVFSGHCGNSSNK